MIKRTILVLLCLVLLIPMFPREKASAAASHFTFPTEAIQPDSARVVTSERIDLTGTINNVAPNSITYSLYQIVNYGDPLNPADDIIGQKRENSNTNIVVTGSSLSVFNLQLFPGLNKITFQGTQGFATVSDTIYINYRNGPSLYNLTANLGGSSFTVKDAQTTVVYSSTTNGSTNADISITGNAPNAEKVTIEVNGQTRTYPVSATNSWVFFASPINLKQGKNKVTFKLENGNQVVETTRDIAFYNGSVTFYDVNISNNGTNPSALEYQPNYGIAPSDLANLRIDGTVILPNYYNNGANPDPTNPASAPITITMPLDTGSVTDVVYATIPASVSYNVQDPFFIMTFSDTIGTSINNLPGAMNTKLSFDKIYYPIMQGQNSVNIASGTGQPNEGTSLGNLSFSLRDNTKSYIYDINYLPGYTASSTDSDYANLVGVNMENASIFTMPLGVEFLIANPSSLQFGGNYSNDLIKILNITDTNGNSTSTNFSYKLVLPNNTYRYVTKTVNGQTQTFLKVIMEIDKLPTTGTQTIQFQLNDSYTTIPANNGAAGRVSTELKNETITLIYGPFIKFNKAYDEMKIDDDTTVASSRDTILTNILDNFSGQLFNISNTADIIYADNAPTQYRTVNFYINNTLIDLEQLGSDPTKFIIKGMDPSDNSPLVTTEHNKAVSALLGGENTAKITIVTPKNSYEKTLKFYLVPTNLPIIPVDGTNGVFPYSTTYNAPEPNDPNFVLNGSIYTTKQAKLNVNGTFDFLDLGTTAAAVSSKTSSIRTSGAASNYLLKIVSAGQADITWDLNDTFYADGTSIAGNTPNPDLRVDYDLTRQYFSFTLFNQSMPTDGTAKIYNIFVYNSGESGPRASYRLEVDPVSIPYTIVRPLLPQKATVNQNYVDVVIYAEGADSVTINKLAAKKVNFDTDNDGTVDYQGAFEATVTGLRANRPNTIKFQITRGKDKFSDQFDINYVPTDIPGGQYMAKMTSKQKVFDNALELDFVRGTSLIRKDYNVPQALKNQVFDGNQLLFAIANPEDGVVDRREFETLPANFDNIVKNFGIRFKTSFPSRFIKASPVYWIDAGMADDPNTAGYDPLSSGALPYQFPSSGIPSYDDRPANRELVPSKRGTLKIAFDPSIRQIAGTIITAFHYDPINKMWDRLGGVVDTKKNTIEVPFEQFGYYVVGELSYSFADVTQHPYARNELEAIYAKGVMNSINSGEFGVDYYVTRGEFTRMIVRALDIPLNYLTGGSHFDDVPYLINPDGLWDYRYIETAAREGIVRGTLPRIFEPNNYLTREQAAYIIAVALNLKMETNATKAKAAVQKAFKDGADISYYFQSAVAAIAKKGFISGSPIDVNNPKAGYVFKPQADLTRADASIILSKVMADLKKLPKMN